MRRLTYMVCVTLLAMGAASGGVLLWRNLYPPAAPLVPATAIGTAIGAPSSGPSSDMTSAPPSTSVQIGDRRPDISLQDLDGRVRSISEWDGSVLVVNFWATWCPPCLEEIPTFVNLQERYRDRGVVFLGIALDSPERAAAFMSSHGVNYETLHGEKDAIDASKAFGNSYGALPFTAVIARDGRITHLQQGILEEARAVSLIEEAL